MKTRVGKIARLPLAIREQLNQRLSEGERGKDLVAWLNGLPEVQKVMAEQFGGHRMREQNLSEWKKGGFEEWLRHQDARDRIRALIEQGVNFNQDEGDIDLSENLAFSVTVELMAQVQDLNEMKDPRKRWRKFREISRELSRIRRDDQRFRRHELRENQWESTLETVEEEPDVRSEPAHDIKTIPENPTQNPSIAAIPQSELRPDPT